MSLGSSSLWIDLIGVTTQSRLQCEPERALASQAPTKHKRVAADRLAGNAGSDELPPWLPQVVQAAVRCAEQEAQDEG